MSKKIKSTKKKTSRVKKSKSTRTNKRTKVAVLSKKKNSKLNKHAKTKATRKVNGSASKARKNRKRDIKKIPGLEKGLYSKIKQEYFDYDYIDKLSVKEKEWLGKFTNEYLGANLNSEGKKFHKTKKKRKDVWDMNNARQRDIQSISKATGTLTNMSEIQESLDSIGVGSEDSVIEYLDLKNSEGSKSN